MKRQNKKGTWVITFKLCKNFDVRFERTKQKAKRTARTTSCRTFTREREDNRRRAGASSTFCKVSLVTRKFQLILRRFLPISFISACSCWMLEPCGWLVVGLRNARGPSPLLHSRLFQLHPQSTPLVTPARHDRLHMRENVPNLNTNTRRKANRMGRRYLFFL